MGNIEKGEEAAVYHRKKSADADMTYMEQVQALETKMGKRFSESEIIMIDKVKAQMQGANAEKDIPYGYQENKDTGELEVVEDRAEKVKIIYEKLLDYSEHPPKELVEAKIEDAREVRREKLTYEEAEKEVTFGEILEYIAKELGKKQETDKKEMVPIMYGKKKDSYSGIRTVTEAEPIITEEQWQRLQKKQ